MSVLFLLLGFFPVAIWPVVGKGTSTQPLLEGNYLRTIGQAWSSLDAELKDKNSPPEVFTDVYDFAAYLARSGFVTDPKVWLSRFDHARGAFDGQITSMINSADTRQLDPKFKATPLAFAIALFPAGNRISDLPASTPLAWTRGLQPDGTWRKDSPYGDWGGFVAFADGSLERYQSINRKLITWAGRATNDIRETLPPGTRISEYTPSEEDLRRGRRAEML